MLFCRKKKTEVIEYFCEFLYAVLLCVDLFPLLFFFYKSKLEKKQSSLQKNITFVKYCTYSGTPTCTLKFNIDNSISRQSSDAIS
jgi:hypothetical protein